MINIILNILLLLSLLISGLELMLINKANIACESSISYLSIHDIRYVIEDSLIDELFVFHKVRQNDILVCEDMYIINKCGFNRVDNGTQTILVCEDRYSYNINSKVKHDKYGKLLYPVGIYIDARS